MRERRTEDAEENQEDGRRRQTHEKGGETHIVAVVETRAASIEAGKERLTRPKNPVVDGATHTQKDDVESNGGCLENVAKVFVLFLCGVQLVLRPGVLTVLDLDEVDVAPRFADVFRSVLSGVGGCTSGWRCC